MSETFDAIVVGAGSVGIPTAMALGARGLRTLVVDRHASPGQGENKHAIGGVRATHSAPGKILACMRSIRILSTWKELYEFEKRHVGPGGMANGKRHQATNLLLEPIGPDEVHVTHDMIVLEVADVPRVVATGRYDRSVVVRTAEGWRFKSRRLTVDPGFFKISGHEAGTRE